MWFDGLVRRFRGEAAEAPSLYDVIPNANVLPRSLPRFEFVPADAIVGTTRHPSNTTADFLPPGRPNAHWRDDWRRIRQAQESLTTLPAVELIKADGSYFVVDGHKRVAAARLVGAVLDASVVELHLPTPAARGRRPPSPSRDAPYRHRCPPIRDAA